jgi:hypothetical protein
MGLRPEQLKLPTEHLILNLEGVIVNLVYNGVVAQAKPTRSRFDPLEGGLFGALLIFQNGAFLSAIVNDFKFVYLVRLSVLHNPAPISQLATAGVSQHLIRSFCKRLVENRPKIWRCLPTGARPLGVVVSYQDEANSASHVRFGSMALKKWFSVSAMLFE